MVPGHNGWGQMEEVKGSLLVTSHSLYFKIWWFGKEVCYISFPGLLCSCLRLDQVQTDSGKDRKWEDVVGFTSQKELLLPPQLYLWNA